MEMGFQLVLWKNTNHGIGFSMNIDQELFVLWQVSINYLSRIFWRNVDFS